jgi:hypothetical protein
MSTMVLSRARARSGCTQAATAQLPWIKTSLGAEADAPRNSNARPLEPDNALATYVGTAARPNGEPSSINGFRLSRITSS